MSADYSIELISIETYAPQFIGRNKIFLGSVIFDLCSDQICMYLNLDAQPEIKMLNWLKWTDSIVKPKSVNKNIAEFKVIYSVSSGFSLLRSDYNTHLYSLCWVLFPWVGVF